MGQDWAESNNGTCLSKALLDCVSQQRDNGGLSVYFKYMSEASLIDLDVSFSGLSRFGRIDPRVIANLQYQIQFPDREPAHWSIFSKDDVGRLANLMKLRFVIYAYTPSKSEIVPPRIADDYWIDKINSGYGSGRLTLCHDLRGVEEIESAGELFGVVITTSKPYRLFRVRQEHFEQLDAGTHLWFASEPGRPAEACINIEHCNNDYLLAIDKLLRIPPRQSPALEEAPTMRDIVEADRSRLYSRWGVSVMIGHFCRRLGKSFLTRGGRHDPKRTLITCLAIASDRAEAGSCEDFADHADHDTIVVCVYAQKYVCLAAEPYRLQFLINHLDTRGLSDKLLNRSDLSGVPRNLSRNAVADALTARQKKRVQKAGSRLKKVCRCRVCKSSKYTANMAPAGPERLCTSPYSITDLLTMLGALDDKAAAVVKRMVELSVAAMDIESSTIDLDLNSSHPGPRVRYDEFGGPMLGGHVFKTQRPIMLGHTDTLAREEGLRWYDTVADDSPKAVYDMMARYWLYVSQRQRKAFVAKKELAVELLALSGLYKDAFFTFSNAWLEASVIQRDYLLETERRRLQRLLDDGTLGSDEFNHFTEEAEDRFLRSDDWKMASMSDLASAFRSSLPGLLEAKIAKLCHRYIVFNFYG